MTPTKYIKLKNSYTLKQANELFYKRKNNLEFVIGICVNNNNIVLGIITLGDLRRALTKGKPNEKINKYLNKNFFYIDYNVPEYDYNNKLNNFLKNKKIDFNSPVLILKNKKLLKLISISSLKSEIKYKSVCIIGLGHVGLPFSVYLANKGLHTIGFDKDKKKLNIIKKKNIFVEKDLNELRKKTLKNKTLILEKNFQKINSQIYIVCVGAELLKNKISSKNLEDIIINLSNKIQIGDLIIIRGTMLVGQTKEIVRKFEQRTNLKVGRDFYVSYCPERLIEGNALEELKKLPQIVSGATMKCMEKSINFWNSLSINTIKSERFEEAEIIKLGSNSYRDLIFSFSNDLCKISSKYNLEINDLIDKANIGYERNDFKKPSPGVGGSCLVKDPVMFMHGNKHSAYRLGKISRKINENSVEEIYLKIKKIKNKFKLKNFKILIFGITYKGDPETSDIRSSTSIDLAKKLDKGLINYNLYDITLKKFNMYPSHLKNKILTKEHNFKNYDLIILMNNHNKTEEILIKNLKKTSSPKFIYDCWNMLQKETVEYLNYKYISLSKNYF